MVWGGARYLATPPGRSNEKHSAERLGDSPRRATRQIIPPSRLDALALQLESGSTKKLSPPRGRCGVRTAIVTLLRRV